MLVQYVKEYVRPTGNDPVCERGVVWPPGAFLRRGRAFPF